MRAYFKPLGFQFPLKIRSRGFADLAGLGVVSLGHPALPTYNILDFWL
jgi:hypothetical protein